MFAANPARRPVNTSVGDRALRAFGQGESAGVSDARTGVSRALYPAANGVRRGRRISSSSNSGGMTIKAIRWKSLL